MGLHRVGHDRATEHTGRRNTAARRVPRRCFRMEILWGRLLPPPALCVNVSRDDPGIQPMFKTYMLSGKGDCFWGVGPGVGRTITFQLTPQMKFTWE